VCDEWGGLAWLAGVWMEMVWPLDEGAAAPLCVRTVDQGAPDGGCASWILAPIVQPASGQTRQVAEWRPQEDEWDAGGLVFVI
jgi:hypothetical protein